MLNPEKASIRVETFLENASIDTGEDAEHQKKQPKDNSP
jgi:hypothetical protein